VLDDLAAAHLVIEAARNRFRMHDLVRLYAVELVQAREEEAGEAQRRLLDYYLHTAHAAALLLSPHREPLAMASPRAGVAVTPLTDLDEAMAWFTAEHAVLMATIGHAGDTGFDAYAHTLPWTLATYFDRRGHWQDWVQAQRVAVDAAGRIGDWAAQARAHRLLANAYSNLRAYPEALTHLQSALALFDRHDDDAGRAHTQFDIALLFDREARPADALRHAVLSLTFYRATGNQLGEAVALNAVGWYHCQLGEYPQAIENCRRALDLTRAAGSSYGQANTWDSLGYAHHHLAEYPQAIECFQHAIELFRDIGDSHAEAITLDHLGDSLDAAGERAAAQDAWRTALDLLDTLNHPEADQLRRKLTEADPTMAS
jgi:tetratricopeptide (TPR) repeat protein